MTTNELCTQLGVMAEWCYQAQEQCARGEHKIALDILQVQLTPKMQTIAHELWVSFHKSGEMPK